MPLSEKVPRSGLDLSRRTRPTLALLPRGNWLRYSWYDFPGLLAGGMDRLINYALSIFASAASLRGSELKLSRFILSAHSGGGMPAIDAIAGARRLPDELHIFDGLYGRDPATGDPMRGLETIDHWLGERFAREPDLPRRVTRRLHRAADRPIFARSRQTHCKAFGERRSAEAASCSPPLPS